jgi:hypothetical protein
MSEICIIRHLDSRYTRNFGRGFSHGAAVFTCYQQIDVATDLLRGGNRVQGCDGDFVIVVFDYD